MDEIIRLRAHHLLCLHGFRGLGYNEEFVSNMARVHRAVMTEHERCVQLLAEPDDICAACPRLSEPGNGCVSRVVQKDLNVLALLNLAPESIVESSSVMARVRERFTPEMLEQLCGYCRWYKFGYCAEGLKAI